MSQLPPQQQKSPAPAARVVKHSAIEGLMRGHGITPGTMDMAQVIELCGGIGGLPAEVPADRFSALLEWLARRYFPSRPLPEGLRSVGMRMLHGYRETLLGKIQLKALNLMGPDRLMRKLGEFIGRNSNFGERTSEQVGPQHYRVHFRGVPVPPEFYQGLCEAAFDIMEVKGVRITIERLGPEDVDFDLRWG
ncbi:MAG: DUF2378 family protein [Myxococcaceae bacterium]|nr:DUF2378 family protein [Myxococcaceae bacterium]